MKELVAIVVLVALLLAAGAYCAKLEVDGKREQCREIMEHGTPEAKATAAAVLGACHP